MSTIVVPVIDGLVLPQESKWMSKKDADVYAAVSEGVSVIRTRLAKMALELESARRLLSGYPKGEVYLHLAGAEILCSSLEDALLKAEEASDNVLQVDVVVGDL